MYKLINTMKQLRKVSNWICIGKCAAMPEVWNNSYFNNITMIIHAAFRFSDNYHTGQFTIIISI